MTTSRRFPGFILVLSLFFSFFSTAATMAGPGMENEGRSFSCTQVQRYFLMGTAAVTGGYFTVGNALAEEINGPGSDLLLIPEATGGSAANLNFLNRGDLELAFIQSDTLWNHVHGKASQAASSSRRIAILGALYPECILLLTRADKDFRRLDDLRGRRISIGEEGSATADNARMILSQGGFGETDLRLRLENATRGASALLSEEADALFLITNASSPLIQNLDARAPMRAIPLSMDLRDRLIASHPFLTRETLPLGTFSQQSEEVPTIGLRALLVSTSDLPDRVAERILQVLFEVFPGQRLGTIFDQISLKNSLEGIEPALLHPAARRFFTVHGILSGNAGSSNASPAGN